MLCGRRRHASAISGQHATTRSVESRGWLKTVLRKLPQNCAIKPILLYGSAQKETIAMMRLEVAPSLSVLRLRFVNLFQDGQRFVQVFLKIVAHQGKYLEQDRIANGIEDLVPGLPIHDKLSRSKNGQVLRDVGLFHAELLNQVAGREFSISKQLDDRDSGWVPQSLEYIGLEAT